MDLLEVYRGLFAQQGCIYQKYCKMSSIVNLGFLEILLFGGHFNMYLLNKITFKKALTNDSVFSYHHYLFFCLNIIFCIEVPRSV